MALAVIDDGYGLPSALLPLLFDPLRAEGRIAHDHGPGLALVRHLVELHGGRLDAESAGEGQGTTMRVCLPLMQGGARAGVAQAHPLTGGQSLEGLRVLVVDDEREVRESFALLLQQEGAEVRMAGSGREAVCLVTDASEKDRPQVLLCDIAMPDQDGCATLRRIRAWEDARADGTHVPAVAVTANTRQEDRLRAAAAGFELYLTKPVTPADLALAVARAAQAVRH